MLVGRESERRTIDALIAGARVGQSGVLVLTGEAGIGKTALLQYAASTASGIRLLRAVGTEAESDVPFGGLAQLLRPSEADLAQIPAPQAEALGIALALRAGRAADRLAVGAATLSLLTRYSEDHPIGLVIDDAHLIDSASGAAIAFAVRRLLADPVVVIAAARAGEPCALTAADIPQLRLAGLDLPSVRRLVATRSDQPAPPDLPARLHQATGGNPLAVLELGARPSRLLTGTPGSPVPVPATIADHFARRIGRLSPPARVAALLAATAGGDLSVVHRAAAELDVDLDAALGSIEEAGLVNVGVDRIEFFHPLVRSAVYASASARERRRMHAALASALPMDSDRRAWHLCDATLGPDDQVADTIELVGRRASDRAAYSVAATAFQRAALLSTSELARASRLLAAGEASWNAGDAVRALATVAESLTLNRSAAHRARALGLRGEIEARSGSLEAARQTLLSAADEITPAEPDRAIVLLAQTVNACFYLGDAATAVDAAARTEALLEQTADPVAIATGTMAIGIARVLAGVGGMDRVRQAVTLIGATDAVPDEGSLSGWRLLGPLFLRESETGRQLLREAVDDRRSRAVIGGLPRLLFYIARDGATTEHWARAESDYAEAIGLARELGQTTDLAISLAGLAWLEARLGRTEDAATHAQEALQLCTDSRIHLGSAWARFALGEADLGLGRPVEAAQTFTELEQWLATIGVRDADLSPAPELSEALVLVGRTDEAREVSSVFTDRATAKGQPWAMARAARSRAMLAAEDDFDAEFSLALDLHGRTLDVFEQARTHLAYGSRLRRIRRRVDARPHLRAALHTFRSLNARLWAETAAGELRATGESAPARGSVGLDELTARERQVAVLLAEGRTTREAAAALFLSPKTVEYHLRHVYSKFGIATRAELAGRMRTAAL